ncbi:NADP-dependent malic enzyme [Candidatus Woesebacteria bacterium]|nr:NADP-dependent malic enzyme [Candidatus Woesebacteria bacterium]
MQTIDEAALALHKKYRGKLGSTALFPVKDKETLSLVYTPGVGAVSKAIASDPQLSFEMTNRGRTIAVVSDGSAVLGLGNIGPEAAMPVMEGKSLLMKLFADVDSVPLVIKTQDVGEIINFVKLVSPSFAGINLEDISAPRCFEVEEALQEIGIPVFHDDQHGTAIVVMAALLNAAKVVKKSFDSLNVVVVGAGAAGLAVTKMLLGIECQSASCRIIEGAQRVGDVIVVDSQGALWAGRDEMNVYKQAVAGVSNRQKKQGTLAEVIVGADVVIGVSGPGAITASMVQAMAKHAIVFAMANPIPEIMPDLATQAGALVVATGRSDYPNQINNVLAFPGIFKAVIDNRLPKITQAMKQSAALALAQLVTKPDQQNILPTAFDPRVVPAIALAVKEAYGK